MTESMYLYYENLSTLDRFLFQTQGFWTTLFWTLTVLRFLVNYSIYNLIESALNPPNVRGMASIKQKYLGQSTKDVEELKKRYPNLNDPTVDSDHMGRDQEFLLICFFTLWWGSDIGDTPKSVKRKKFANFLNVIFIPLTIGVLVLYFHLQETNYILESLEKDWFYFLK
ncbi:hypothetical protein [Roseivirga pacifica]|uniref:hypothetical protein n=1 Tax=Roseivirga pacifica TaxID=1267423 RepID=UPI003BAE59CD